MANVIITGANGLIGTSCCSILSQDHSFETFDISSQENPVDITNKESVLNAVSKSTAEYIVHLAAYTDVTGAWQQTDDTSGPAYKVNVTGTQNLIDACNQNNKHLIHISTSYVFDGEKKQAYTEADATNPIEWYGKTKALSEQAVQESADKWTILRIDQPFKAEKFSKVDLAHKIASDLQNDTLLPQFTDHYFGPTWIPDFVRVIDWVIRTGTTGLYHASAGETWTNHQFATTIAEVIGFTGEIKSSKLEEYLQTNNRPYQKNTALNCSKLLAEIDFPITAIKDALAKVQY